MELRFLKTNLATVLTRDYRLRNTPSPQNQKIKESNKYETENEVSLSHRKIYQGQVEYILASSMPVELKTSIQNFGLKAKKQSEDDKYT